MKKVLLVDGPRAGARYTVPDSQPTLVLPVPVDEGKCVQDILSPGPPWEPNFEMVVYNLHPEGVWLFGRSITIGSVRPMPHLGDLIEVLLSDEAKEALS